MPRDCSTKTPRKPKTPLYYFIQKCIKENIIEASTGFHDRWAHARLLFSRLSDEEKVRFISMSIDDKKRYDKEVKVYCTNNPEYKVRTPSRDIVSKSERDLFDRLNGRPKKPPSCGYLFFSSAVIPLLKGLDPTKRMLKISHLWKHQTPDLVKADYELQSQKANYEYFTAIEEYVSKVSPKERKRIFKEEKIKYPSRRKLQTMEVAINASETADTMNLDELTEGQDLTEDAIILYSYDKLLETLEKDAEFEGNYDTTRAHEEWLHLNECDKLMYLRKVHTCRLINTDTQRQHCGKLEKFLPSSPVTSSVKSDLQILKDILERRLVSKEASDTHGKPMNGYSLFVSRNELSTKIADSRTRLKMAAQLWNELSDMEKEEHSFEAKVIRERCISQENAFRATLNHDESILYTHYLKVKRKRRANSKLQEDIF